MIDNRQPRAAAADSPRARIVLLAAAALAAFAAALASNVAPAQAYQLPTAGAVADSRTPTLSAGGHVVRDSPAQIRKFWTKQRLAAARPFPLPHGAATTPAGGQAQGRIPGPSVRIPGSRAASGSSSRTLSFASTTMNTPSPWWNSSWGRWAMVGRLYSYHPRKGYLGWCTGTVVPSQNQSTIWTAGHCLASGGYWHNKLLFVPGQNGPGEGPNGRPPYGSWTIRYVDTSATWLARNDCEIRKVTCPWGADYGAAVADSNGGATLGSRVGSIGIWFGKNVQGLGVRALGYPSEPPYFDTYAGYLFYCDSAPSAYQLDVAGFYFSPKACGMNGGASGGPGSTARLELVPRLEQLERGHGGRLREPRGADVHERPVPGRDDGEVVLQLHPGEVNEQRAGGGSARLPPSGAQDPRAGALAGRSYCRSSASSSSSVPWRTGPLNQFFAESAHQPPKTSADGREPEHRVVRQLPAEVVLPGEAGLVEREDEQDRDQRHPGDGDRVDPAVVPAEAPGARLERVAHPEAEDHRQDERDVEADHGDRRAGRVADEVVPDRRHHEQPASTTIAQTALRGTRFDATLLQSGCPGTARSRENANIIRDADVTDAVTQKNCATTQMNNNASDQFWLIDSAQIQGMTTPMFSSAPSVLGIANVTASEQDPAEDHRGDDGHVHARPLPPGRFVRLLRQVCGRVESGDRVLRHQQSEAEDEPEDEAARVPVTPLPNPELFTVSVNT